MYYKILISCVLFLMPTISFCQFSLPMEYELSPVLLEFDKGKDFGSGIFFIDSLNNISIVTAKHNIDKYLNHKASYKENSIKKSDFKVSYFAYFSNETDSVRREAFSLNLEEFNENNLVKMHPIKDLAIIKFGIVVNNKVQFNTKINFIKHNAKADLITYSQRNISSFNEIKVTREVFVFGYPKTIGLQQKPQYDFDSPLIQKGIVSSKNYKDSSLVLNCPVFGGNSGSPVIEYNPLNDNIRLIGLITDYIPYIDEENGLKFNSGYSVAVPIEYVISLTKLLNKY